MIVTKLDKLRSEGFDPGEVLDQSTRNSWQDVFPLKTIETNGKPLSASAARSERSKRAIMRGMLMACTKESTFAAPVTYNLPPGLDQEAAQEVWQSAKERLSQHVNKHSFSTWFEPLKAAGIRDQVLYLTVPAPEFLHARDKYGLQISEALGDGLRVEFVLPEQVAC